MSMGCHASHPAFVSKVWGRESTSETSDAYLRWTPGLQKLPNGGVDNTAGYLGDAVRTDITAEFVSILGEMIEALSARPITPSPGRLRLGLPAHGSG